MCKKCCLLHNTLTCTAHQSINILKTARVCVRNNSLIRSIFVIRSSAENSCRARQFWRGIFSHFQVGISTFTVPSCWRGVTCPPHKLTHPRAISFDTLWMFGFVTFRELCTSKSACRCQLQRLFFQRQRVQGRSKNT